MGAGGTRAVLALREAQVAFTLHRYDYDPGADKVGLQAAQAIGVAARLLLKTLMIEVDGHPACAVIPSDRELSLKRAAAAFGGKSGRMMKPAAAERLTGYKVGGISPFAQMRPVPTAMEAASLAEPAVIINGGRRGVLVELAPGDACKLLGATVAPLCA